MSRLAEHRQQMVRCEAAAIVSYVDNQALLTRPLGVQFPFELLEAGPVHALNVNVSQRIFRRFVNDLTIIANPLLIEQPLYSAV